MFHKTLKVLQHPIQNIYFLKATATAFRLVFPKCTRLIFTSLLEDYPPFYKSFFELCELVWFLSSSIKFSSKHRSLGHVCSRHAASVGFCAFVEVALSARLDTCMVPLEPPSSPNGRLQKCWRERLKRCGFPGRREVWWDRSLQPSWPHCRRPCLLPVHAPSGGLLGCSAAPKIQPNPKSTNALPWAAVSHVILRNARNPCGRSKVTGMYSISRSKEPRLLPGLLARAPPPSVGRQPDSGQDACCPGYYYFAAVSSFLQYCS